MTKLQQIEKATKEVITDLYTSRVDAVIELIDTLGLESEIHYETDCGDGDQSAWKIHIDDNTSEQIEKVVSVLNKSKYTEYLENVDVEEDSDGGFLPEVSPEKERFLTNGEVDETLSYFEQPTDVTEMAREIILPVPNGENEV